MADPDPYRRNPLASHSRAGLWWKFALIQFIWCWLIPLLLIVHAGRGKLAVRSGPPGITWQLIGFTLAFFAAGVVGSFRYALELRRRDAASWPAIGKVVLALACVALGAAVAWSHWVG
jgi:hypothetical protein